jgi:hypothetical protein
MGLGAYVHAEWIGAGVPGGVPLETPVGGHDDADIVAEGDEGFRKRAHHVGETANLDERLDLRGYEENLERRHVR